MKRLLLLILFSTQIFCGGDKHTPLNECEKTAYTIAISSALPKASREVMKAPVMDALSKINPENAEEVVESTIDLLRAHKGKMHPPFVKGVIVGINAGIELNAPTEAAATSAAVSADDGHDDEVSTAIQDDDDVAAAADTEDAHEELSPATLKEQRIQGFLTIFNQNSVSQQTFEDLLKHQPHLLTLLKESGIEKLSEEAWETFSSTEAIALMQSRTSNPAKVGIVVSRIQELTTGAKSDSSAAVIPHAQLAPHHSTPAHPMLATRSPYGAGHHPAVSTSAHAALPTAVHQASPAALKAKR